MKKLLGTKATDLTIGQTIVYGFIVSIVCWIPTVLWLHGGKIVDWFKGLVGKKPEEEKC